MKKLFVVALALGLFALPAMAQVEAGAGKITVHADVDFLGKYIAEDETSTPDPDEVNQPQIEDFILRDAILSLQGELSDKVAWELTAQQFGLLTAKIQLKMIPMTTLTFGHFLIDQSPSINYHILSQVHTIYFPMAANAGGNYGSPEQMASVLVPGWQTGVQAQIGNEMVHVTLGWFDGVQPSFDPVAGTLTVQAPMSALQETDNSKAGLVGVHLNASGVIAGISWWDEYSNVDQRTFGTDDLRLNIWDFYLGYKSEKVNVLAEYLENNLDFMDTGMPDNFKQNDWYIQAGVFVVDNAEIVLRYEAMDNFDLARDEHSYPGLTTGTFDADEETWITIGANYFLVDKNAAVSLQYILKDHDELQWNDNELNMLVEVDI